MVDHLTRDIGPPSAGPQGSNESLRLRRFVEHARRQRELARQGVARLSPEGLWLSITENCNFRCVGCYTEGLFKKTYVQLDDLRRMLAGNDAQFSYISLTEGEAFLHPQLCEIIELCKERHPEAAIDLVTNASIPLRGKYRRAVSLIDQLGLSIDGATKETYEAVRHGGNFERFLANVRDIVAVRAETGNPKLLEFSFTAMTTNIAELPDVVRIAAELGVPAVYFQPMEMRHAEIIARVGAYSLTRMPAEDVYKITDEAMRVGRQLGVDVVGADSMTRPAGPEAAAAFGIDEAVRTCQYFWTKPFQYVRDGGRFQVLPCCYMLKSDAAAIARRYGFDFARPKAVTDVYNSEGYWQMRQDLAEGKLDEFCGGCLQAQTHSWHEPE